MFIDLAKTFGRIKSTGIYLISMKKIDMVKNKSYQNYGLGIKMLFSMFHKNKAIGISNIS